LSNNVSNVSATMSRCKNINARYCSILTCHSYLMQFRSNFSRENEGDCFEKNSQTMVLRLIFIDGVDVNLEQIKHDFKWHLSVS
jgi:hypothetical protein